MEINNIDDKDVEELKKCIDTKIRPDNPFVSFRVYNTKSELKRVIKEAVKEALQETDIMKEYEKTKREWENIIRKGK